MKYFLADRTTACSIISCLWCYALWNSRSV